MNKKIMVNIELENINELKRELKETYELTEKLVNKLTQLYHVICSKDEEEVGLYNICDDGTVIKSTSETEVYRCEPKLNKKCHKRKCAYFGKGACECTQYKEYAATTPPVRKNGF